MPLEKQFISFYTIVRKGVIRIFRIWSQTLLPPLVTSVLYFAIFGTILGSRIGELDGVPYILFVVPGLVMLSVITSAFMEVASTFFFAKFFSRNIDEVLVSPTPTLVIIAGFITSGIIRGMLVGVLVLIVSFFFALPSVAHPLIVLLFLFLSSLVFSLGGLINGIYAKSFDSITIVPTFVLTPLVYLGGVFYSIHSLPPLWQTLSLANPVFYIINGFRYGFLGTSDVSIFICTAVLLLLTGILLGVNWYFLKKGLGLKQ
ncbi:ABC transporter permease [Candidatus Kaiserbacteria bacterium RIFCSPLOWO2_01_FULL_55_19]|uniref:Transport permease protein n=1 Tax=Candidatus Kaiserbacteria bacterium RIFCSPLOWO2_01_FULL_55_19 TaxID=1798516 RepID=A0A1F6ES85_9BACT|nr:MAG: ABC transporter permease [Candidatus Kaiserbacteria bacterium RIFCSPLOWO2_01_FULL_55_19]